MKNVHEFVIARKHICFACQTYELCMQSIRIKVFDSTSMMLLMKNKQVVCISCEWSRKLALLVVHNLYMHVLISLYKLERKM